ncbi:hypothetical protein DT23_04115 [Thioclava indica]|uniref:Uncharacterized protein n=1 Tax=Thioclava indica TaxID=1353528 RepID=A0A074JTR4_9RHOB|nr:hypothetical protein DT23_04115 [Thioclava indica]
MAIQAIATAGKTALARRAFRVAQILSIDCKPIDIALSRLYSLFFGKVTTEANSRCQSPVLL